MRLRSASPRPAATARAARSSLSSKPRACRQFHQRLALLALARGAQEQPAEQQDRDDRPLDHHDRAGGALVVGGRDAPLRLAGGVAGIQDAAGPQERVGQHALDQPHGDDVADLRAVAEPRRLGQRAQQRHPHRHPERDEQDVLQRVHGGVLHRALVERGQVPEVEVRRPGRERHDRVREHAQPADSGRREQRLQQRAGEPEHQQQRAEVGEQQVLEHVGEEQLLGDMRQRRDERRRHQRQPAVPAPLPPGRDGRAAVAQRPRPQPVHDRARQRGCELQRRHLEGHVGEHRRRGYGLTQLFA